MESNSIADLGHPTDNVTKQTVATASLTGSEEAATVSMFNHAQNTYITNGSFIITTNHIVPEQRTKALDTLYSRAAPNAILNAGGRADEVRCYPGTREEVISRIENWRDDQDSQTPIFWLSGPAGAGKTAIAQTIAERCREQGIPQANFFFFRTDPSRNSQSPLVATLVHQIILLYPALQVIVADVLSNNRLILDSNLEDQLTQLIVTPLETIRQSSSSYIMPLLLIDGLDECESEEKRSQRRILQAFDEILVKDPCLFRLLVASRDESRIQTTFNNISSRLLPLYLDNQYKPEKDIRTFVIAEFKRVRKTHPLRPDPNAKWPSARDIEDIVKKSSGQFIYAATVMRFIMDSSASPMLNLERVRGAAQIATKSPFSYLDAIYTYILSQPVDNQQVLKDILCAQLFIQSFDNLSSLGVLTPLLEACDPRWSQEMVRSCLADLTPIARYTKDHELLFHHASFPDFLLDPSRSGIYFVDLHAFNFRIQPEVWEARHILKKETPPGFHHISLNGLVRLSQLPPGLLDAVISVDERAFIGQDGQDVAAFGIFEHLYGLCKHEDDITKYKQIVHQWAVASVAKRGPAGPWKRPREDVTSLPPYVRRYIAMSDIETGVGMEVYGWRRLRDIIPKTAADTDETAGWLVTLLQRLYGESYNTGFPYYNHLVRKWTLWAAQNGIPLDGVEDLPNVQWYHTMAIVEQDVTIDVALHGGNVCNVSETAAWLTSLLRRIHQEKYNVSIPEYNRLIRKWTSWAVDNDIPLVGMDDLPSAQWYREMANIGRNFMAEIALHREKDCNVSETVEWLATLLRRIHREKYHTNVPEYNRLLRKWMSWAIWSDIPLDGVDDLPNARWYYAMANIEQDITIDIPLHRDKDCDVPETAAWLTTLLHCIHGKKYHSNLQEYNRLLQTWTSWATWNDIPLDGVGDLPNAWWYSQRSTIEKWLVNHLGLGSRQD